MVLGTWVNKGKKKGRGSLEPQPLVRAHTECSISTTYWLRRTVQVRLSGVASVLPAASVALTWKLWEPLASLVYFLGEEQALKCS
jgi:hypothetical protein